jgi:gamma-glutamyltranspeptidase/glutathione hydrolase
MAQTHPPRLRAPGVLAFAALALLLSACAGRPGPSEGPATRQPAIASVGAANPMAVDAGLAVLEAGGSAADAAVAVQAVLGLVEPQSSGIGGGAFLMYYEASSRRVLMFDGREVAPAGADPRMFLDAEGMPLPFDSAVVSGRSIGVPGAIPMLGVVHGLFGKRTWASLFDDGIRLAERGFVVPRRLGRFANGSSAAAAQPDIRALFTLPNGRLARAGDTLRNAAYARTLRAIASRGPRALHEGEIAAAIVARATAEPRAGAMTVEDLARYGALEREALCRPYRQHTVCVPPPPSSGYAVLQLLAMLDLTATAALGPDDAASWYNFAEASRLMYADRDRYLGDPGFVDVPVRQLLDSAYVRSRVALIRHSAPKSHPAGEIAGYVRGDDETEEAGGTSHFVITDFDGNVVSMTTTVESVFGSGRAVGGFILNNELTDFSMVPEVNGVPVANAVAPGKRPRSSMAPMIILDADRRFVAAIGSPGGSSILAYNAKTALGVFGWGLPMQTAIDLPNLVARGERFSLEAGRLSRSIREALGEWGVTLTDVTGEDSGLHGVIVREGGRLEGGADPRRDGVWRVIIRR